MDNGNNNLDKVDILTKIVFFVGFILCSAVMIYYHTQRNLIWSVTTLVLFVLVILKRRDYSSIKNPIFAVFLFYLLAVVYSVGLATNRYEAVSVSLKVVTMIVYLFVGTIVLKEQKWFARIIILTTITVGICSLYECFLLPVAYRTGLMGNKNMCASALFLLMCLCLHYWKHWRLLSSVAITLSLFAIITLRSRGSWLAVIVSVIACGIIYRKYLLAILVLAVISAGIVYAHYEYRIFDSGSAQQRIEIWGHTARMIKDNPVGVGAGNWQIIFPSYGSYMSPQMRDLVYMNKALVRTHNDWLQILSETGPLGFAGYLLLFVLALYYSRGWIRIGILGFMVVSMVSFPMERSFHSMILMVYFSLAILQVRYRDINIKRRWFAPVIIILCVSVIASTDRFVSEKQTIRILEARANQDWDTLIAESNDISWYSGMDIHLNPLEYFRGVAFCKKNDFENALNSFQKAKELNPNHLYMLMNLAACQVANNEYYPAIESFYDAHKMFPDFAGATNSLSTVIRRSFMENEYAKWQKDKMAFELRDKLRKIR